MRQKPSYFPLFCVSIRLKGEGARLKKQIMSVLYSYCARKGHSLSLRWSDLFSPQTTVYLRSQHCLVQASASLTFIGSIVVSVDLKISDNSFGVWPIRSAQVKPSNTTLIFMLTDRLTPQSFFSDYMTPTWEWCTASSWGKFPLLYWSKSSKGDCKLQIVLVTRQSFKNF